MKTEKDFLERIVWQTPPLRMAFGSFRAAASEAIVRHDADPLAGRLLADGIGAAGLLSVLLDEKEKFSIRIDYGKAPARGLLLESNADGSVRGFIRAPHLMPDVPDLDCACGNSSLCAVTRSCEGQVRNSGQSESAFALPSQTLGYYLCTSEQQESELRVELSFQREVTFPVRCASGVLLQALPGCDFPAFDEVRNRLNGPEAGELLRSDVLSGAEKRDALLKLLAGGKVPETEVFPVPPVRFFCPCSGEKIWRTAATVLGEEEMRKLLQENPDPEIRCQFCGAVYRYRDSRNG